MPDNNIMDLGFEINMDEIDPFAGLKNIDWSEWEANWAEHNTSLAEEQANTCGEGKKECPDGTCVDVDSNCYDARSTGRHAEGTFIQEEGEDPNQSYKEIYDAIGGEGWTNMGFDEWLETYKEDFPTWEGSIYEAKYKNLDATIDMLGDERELSERSQALEAEALRFTQGAELENITGQREALIRAGGGLRSGAQEKKVESAYDRVLRGFDLEADRQQISTEQSLIDFEKKSRQYDVDLDQIVVDYQDSMDALISDYKEPHSGCKDEERNEDGNCPNEDNDDEDVAEGCEDCNIVMSGLDELTPVCIDSSGVSCPDECCQ